MNCIDKFNRTYNDWLDASIESHIFKCEDCEELQGWIEGDIDDFEEKLRSELDLMNGRYSIKYFIAYQKEFERLYEDEGFDNDMIYEPIKHILKFKVEQIDWEAKYQLYKESETEEEEEVPQA